jgi:hypothetical protein
VSRVDDDQKVSEQEVEEKVEGLSWAATLGAISGLVVGVVMAMLVSAGLHRWNPDSELAQVFWEIASPLLGIVGVILGALCFHRYLRRQLIIALVITLALTALGLYLAFGPVGFPWREGN